MQYWEDLLRVVVNHKKETGVPFSITSTLSLGSNKEHKNIQSKTQRRCFLGSKFPGQYFTLREAQVAYYLVLGQSMKLIAKSMGISSRTVEFYLKNMRRKLDCRNRSELTRIILCSELFSCLTDNFCEGAL